MENDAPPGIGAGIPGLGLAASLSNRDRYYGHGHDPYGCGYYRAPCHSRMVWHSYYGDYVRARCC